MDHYAGADNQIYIEPQDKLSIKNRVGASARRALNSVVASASSVRQYFSGPKYKEWERIEK
jgi:hypothetical protein